MTIETKMDDLITAALEQSAIALPSWASADWRNEEEGALFAALATVHVSRALVMACYKRHAPIEFMTRSRLELRRHELALHTATQALGEARAARCERELEYASADAETRVTTKLAKDFSVQVCMRAALQDPPARAQRGCGGRLRGAGARAGGH